MSTMVRESPVDAPFLSRQQILDATEACFAQGGYDGTTIRAIAGRLGCSVGSLYRYFTDKRSLLLACGERLVRPVLDSLDQGAGLEESQRLYARRAAAHPELYRLTFWACGPRLPQTIEQVIDRWAELLGSRAEAEHCWALLHGMLMLGTDRALASIRPATTAARPSALPVAPVPPEPEPEEDVTLL